jgi:hypothetical protein
MAAAPFAGPTNGLLGATSGALAFTIPSGHSNVVLVVEVKREFDAGVMTSIKWNGGAESLTLLDIDGNAANFAASEVWYLKNPTPGSFNLDWVKTTDGITNHGSLIAYAVDGADLTTTFGTVQKAHNTAGTSDSLTVPTVAAGDFTIDVISIDGTGHAAAATGAGHSLDWGPLDSGAGTNEGYGGKSTASGSVPMNWTWTTSAPFSHIAVNIRAAPVADPGSLIANQTDTPGQPGTAFFNGYIAPPNVTTTTTPVGSDTAVGFEFEAPGGVSAGAADPVESAQAVAGSGQGPVESSAGVAATGPLVEEAGGGVASPSADPVESAQSVVSAGALVEEAAQGVVASVVVVEEAPGGVASALSDAIEALGGVASLGDLPIEAVGLTVVTATGSLPVESTQGVATPGADPLEVASGLSTSVVEAVEALARVVVASAESIDSAGGVAASAVEPVESAAAVASLATDAVEALQRLAVSGGAPVESAQGAASLVAAAFESTLGVAASGVLPIEALGLVAVIGSASVPVEALGAVLASVSAQVEVLAVVGAASAQTPLESAVAVKTAVSAAFESALGVASLATSPLDELAALVAVVVLPVEAGGQPVVLVFGRFASKPERGPVASSRPAQRRARTTLVVVRADASLGRADEADSAPSRPDPGDTSPRR